MKPITRISGTAAALPLPNLDTDVIIRIEHLAQCPKEQLGNWCFGPLRFLPNGAENPSFILNQPPWRGAPILVAGPNFGCGSSREHAVWALQGMGIACLIAPSFGDIFYSNCFQNGLLPVVLDTDQVTTLSQRLLTAGSQPIRLTIDLERQTVCAADGKDIHFAIEPRRREALMEGLDPLGTTLKQSSLIEQWQAHDRHKRPWVWQSVGGASGT